MNHKSQEKSNQKGVSLDTRAEEPRLAINTKRPLDRYTASILLADSILILIRTGWAFRNESRFTRTEYRSTRRWSLSAEAASLWNEIFAPMVDRMKNKTEPDSVDLQATGKEIFQSTTVANEVLVSMTLLLCEIWKENLLARSVDFLQSGTEVRNGIGNKQRETELGSLDGWRRQCVHWANSVAPTVLEQKRKEREIAIMERELARRATAEREERAQQLKALQQEEALARMKRAKEQAEAERHQAEEREKKRREYEEEIRETVRRISALKQLYRERLADDYLSTVSVRQFSDATGLLDSTTRRELEAEFVKGWLGEARNVVLSYPPGEEQIRAISRVEPKLLVRARAGSGKTSTIVARVVFLIRHCRVQPQQILLFAFNKSAAVKLEHDLQTALNLHEMTAAEVRERLPVVQTFDAFAQAVSGLGSFEDHEQDALVQRVIEEILKIEEPRLKAAMLDYFRADWDQIEAVVKPGQALVLSSRRSEQALLTLNGEQVKSRGEHRIANWLFEHGVPYRYEKPLRAGGAYLEPDFTLFPDGSNPIVVEYLGLMGDPDYDEKTNYKRSVIAKIPAVHRPHVIWLKPESTNHRVSAQMEFVEILTSVLAARGTILQKLSDEEIWEKIKTTAISTFRTFAITIIERSKQARWDATKLKSKASASKAPLLLDLCADILSRSDHYNQSGRLTYPEICWSAAELLNNQQTPVVDLRSQTGTWRPINMDLFSDIIIDEFQDFSDRFAAIVQSLLRRIPKARLYVVGDDWQAINRYAGSEPRYITEWEDPELVLANNHRSLPKIVEISNDLMVGRGPKAIATPNEARATVQRMSLLEFSPDRLEIENVRDHTEMRPHLVAAISRLAIPHLRKGQHVAILAQTNREVDLHLVPKSKSIQKSKISNLQSLLSSLASPGIGPIGALEVSTVHTFKGRQADVVILLADNFPLLHPHRVLTEVFGDSEEVIMEDQRRLLYVGLTRAKHSLYLLVGLKERSGNFEKSLSMEKGSWRDHPAVGTHIEKSPRRSILVRGGRTFDIKEELKSAGFLWSGNPLKRWERIMDDIELPQEAVNAIVDSPWFPKDLLEEDLCVEVIDSANQVLLRLGRSTRPSDRSNYNESRVQDLDDLPF